MKYLRLLPLILLLSSCRHFDDTRYVIKTDTEFFYAKEVKKVHNGIKFHDLRSGDSIEIYGSYTVTLQEKQEKVTKKDINHNDYSK